MNIVTTVQLPTNFGEAYHQLLLEYLLVESGEESLMLANDLGRRAVNEHCNILDLVSMHQEVVLQVVLGSDTEKDREAYLGRAEEFLAEVLAPFEMMHRGFDDTIRQLQQVNITLEQKVEIRTKELLKSQRKAAELARLYQILSSINSAIVRLNDRGELIGEACRITVEQGGYQSACISMRWDGSSNSETWYRRLTDGTLSRDRPGYDLATFANEETEKVYREKRPVVCHKKKENAGPEAMEKPFSASHALFPLFENGTEISGIFALFSNATNAFNADEIRLLREMAGDLSFAFDHIRKEEQLNYLANYDALTGLPNLNLLLEHLPFQFQQSMRVDNMVALVLVDLANFSKINDTYGRHQGDNLLKQVGERLCSLSANRETVARVGADCFAVSLTGLADMDRVAYRLEEEVLGCFSEPFSIEDDTLHLSAHVGISLFPEDTTDADFLFKNGEMALKQAQKRGDPYLFYNQEMNERVIQSVTMEARLRKAIEGGELIVHYQPVVSTADDSLVGMEALVRCGDQNGGLLPPEAFIPLSEETGMILDIGKCVLLKALEDLQKWRDLGLDPPKVAVNVSPVQLRQKEFIKNLIDILPSDSDRNHGINLEITENALMVDADENILKLQALQNMGFNISIDDFGTGYSSLGYLSRLPVNTLKIDRSFIIDMTERPNSMALVSTIITLAHALEIKVVAEGVDSKEQAKLLKLLRCNYIQGNLYSTPLSYDDMTRFLRK